jgi:hypothetical protein
MSKRKTKIKMRTSQERYNIKRTWGEAEVEELSDNRQMERLGCHKTSTKVETSKDEKY